LRVFPTLSGHATNIWSREEFRERAHQVVADPIFDFVWDETTRTAITI
jgi:hypothetical protein